MADISSLALILGVGIGVSGCCFCSYIVTKCIFGIKIDKPEVPVVSKPLENIVIENPMRVTEDPINF